MPSVDLSSYCYLHVVLYYQASYLQEKMHFIIIKILQNDFLRQFQSCNAHYPAVMKRKRQYWKPITVMKLFDLLHSILWIGLHILCMICPSLFIHFLQILDCSPYISHALTNYILFNYNFINNILKHFWIITMVITITCIELTFKYKFSISDTNIWQLYNLISSITFWWGHL